MDMNWTDETTLEVVIEKQYLEENGYSEGLREEDTKTQTIMALADVAFSRAIQEGKLQPLLEKGGSVRVSVSEHTHGHIRFSFTSSVTDVEYDEDVPERVTRVVDEDLIEQIFGRDDEDVSMNYGRELTYEETLEYFPVYRFYDIEDVITVVKRYLQAHEDKEVESHLFHNKGYYYLTVSIVGGTPNMFYTLEALAGEHNGKRTKETIYYLEEHTNHIMNGDALKTIYNTFIR